MLKRFLKGGDDQSLISAERLLVLVTAGILITLVALQYAAIQARNRDDQRRTDLYSLQLAIQRYYALNGQYPLSLASLSDIPAGACQDPSGKGSCQNPDYNYIAFAAGAQPQISKSSDCNGKKIACAGYILASQHMETTTNPYALTSN